MDDDSSCSSAQEDSDHADDDADNTDRAEAMTTFVKALLTLQSSPSSNPPQAGFIVNVRCNYDYYDCVAQLLTRDGGLCSYDHFRKFTRSFSVMFVECKSITIATFDKYKKYCERHGRPNYMALVCVACSNGAPSQSTT